MVGRSKPTRPAPMAESLRFPPPRPAPRSRAARVAAAIWARPPRERPAYSSPCSAPPSCGNAGAAVDSQDLAERDPASAPPGDGAESLNWRNAGAAVMGQTVPRAHQEIIGSHREPGTADTAKGHPAHHRAGPRPDWSLWSAYGPGGGGTSGSFLCLTRRLLRMIVRGDSRRGAVRHTEQGKVTTCSNRSSGCGVSFSSAR